ncbi:tRNA (adenosine(37)-N6)-threonylcarbamoyltransferase complex transferase subunit TsaD [Candidatus Beckwithbacteria bacterium]|nr:tRNA (adenosine(37)-N6)-threonylcarbamoyltransferase complex transferase subunit TsaD [Candidatus Beckwithbacteria bacterium]
MLYPIILAIDTSCDDTSVAITQGLKVLSNVIASQEEIHRQYGGVMPLMAKLAHNDLINPTFETALKRAKIKKENIDAIAVTIGPGLAIALEVGIEFAKNLSLELGKPLIAANHMMGHLFSSWAVNSKNKTEDELLTSLLENDQKIFPALAFLTSGGHTDLVLVKNIKEVEIVGQTIDDAAGEALDKFARLLDLGYPGAAILEQMAKDGNSTAFNFPLPMTQADNLDFSFSGMKTAGRQQIEKILQNQQKLTKQNIYDLSASFQQAVIKALIYKLKRAVAKYQIKSLWLGGGVVNNTEYRKQIRQFCQQNNLILKFPYIKKLMSDNGAMIGVAAYFQYLDKKFVKDFPTLQRIPRMKI